MSSLIEHYRNLLPMARLVADEKGTIRAITSDGERKIHIVRGKTAVLPTQHHLNADNGNELLFFHPFLEDGGKRVADAVDDYRGRVATTIGLAVLALMNNLATIASSEEHSPPLKTQQVKMMQKLKELDAPTFKQIGQVITAIIADPEYKKSHWPVKIFIGSRGETPREKDTKNFSYWTTVTFPLYDELVATMEDTSKGPKKFAGVSVSNKTLRSLKAVVEYIFNHVAEDNWYTSGSDSDIAPFMVSLLKSMIELTTEINEAIEMFANQPGFEEIKLPVEWMDALPAIPGLYREIVGVPVRGQVSRVRVETTDEETIAPATQPTQRAQQAPQKPVEETVRYARSDKEYIMDERGRWVRNPQFFSSASLGKLGLMTSRNPYDPLATQLIIPDSGVYAPETTAQGAWGNNNNGSWGR